MSFTLIMPFSPSFFLSQHRYFLTFITIFSLHLFLLFSEYTTNSIVASWLQIISGTIIIIGTGASLTIVFQWLLRREFRYWEFITLSLLAAFLLPPLILNTQYFILQKVNAWYPLINSAVLWGIGGILLYFKKTSLPDTPLPTRLNHPLVLTAIFGVIFILIETTSFQTLPDLDPYKWLLKYTYQFDNNLLDYSERPLFGSFTYIFTTLTGIKIYDFFKYALPFLFLTTLFPAWMIARTFSEKSKQWIFLLFAFTSPSTLLYAGTAMPQAPFITITFFFIYLLIYASYTKDKLFLYVAGSSIFLSFFYHQAAFILFFAWVSVVIFTHRKIIFSNKLTVIFISIILLSNLSHFQTIYDFTSYWLRNITPYFFKENNFNLFYPAQYTNTDNNMMGWGSASGVIKFYAYYVGPVLGLVLTLFSFRFFAIKSFRFYAIEQFRNNISLLIGLISFCLFFIIAEIFPRYPGIALLPDRAWIFCGIFTLVFLYLLLRFIPQVNNQVLITFLIFFVVGISGALYINYLKRYLISPLQLQSSEWIQTNLPTERVFLSYGHRNLLAVHADSAWVSIPSNLYCDSDIRKFDELDTTIAATGSASMKQDYLTKDYRQFLEKNFSVTKVAIEKLNSSSLNVHQKYSEAAETQNLFLKQITQLPQPVLHKEITIVNPLSSHIIITAPIPNGDVYNFSTIPSLKEKPLYIYYSRLHLKNPYRNRPYGMKSWGIEPCLKGSFLFDQFPQKFERVYHLKDEFDEVIIWKVL